MVDAVTKERERLNFPRVMVEVFMNQDFPSLLDFEDEFGSNVHVGVKYEWKPVICKHCSGMGHLTDECNKKQSAKQEWVVKEDEGKSNHLWMRRVFKWFLRVKKIVETRGEDNGTKLTNVFQILAERDQLGIQEQEAEGVDNTRGGGEIPLLVMDKFIVWNIRGANKQQKQQAIRQFIRVQGADFVGLLETRVKAHKLGALYLNVFNGWCFSSNIARDKGGRIVIAWNLIRFIVDIIKCTSQLMHLRISTIDGTYNSFLTIVYGFNDRQGRLELWRDLNGLKTKESWIVMGDFNAITTKEERVGHRVKYQAEMEFISSIQHCQLEDVKSTGSFYTWTNKQQGHDRIYSKIDRVLANQQWCDNYPSAEALFLNEGTFDHTPCISSLYPKWKCGKKPFKYFRMWKSHPEYDKRVEMTWRKVIHGTLMYQVVSKLKALKPVLKEINQLGFSDLHATSIQTKKALDEVQSKLQEDPLNTTLHD
ncbi:hypothetical protein CsatB_001402 [Cannabis sativa]|uniref:uncharacterized protein LOC115696570 n=1 Tax=Cannabis sativa TaxID=3483 RepID=UPI0011E062F3|nr:uncharacterized protein LOC115696570 [Cannabis sativa]